MSQRMILVILLASVFCFPVFAATELTDEQLKQYNREKLSIEVKTQSYGSFSMRTGTTSSREIKSWTAYKGFNPITEVEFFTLTGFEEEAQKAREHEEGRNRLVWWG